MIFCYLLRKNVIDYKSLFPKIDCGTCTCTDPSAFVIDPEGLLYKCWADVGIKNRSIGTLETGLNNFDIMSEFIQGSDNFLILNVLIVDTYQFVMADVISTE